ncbi:MAG TPA: LuxR C-terminal-related transcriptional regulator [Gaiellaceae bacterium]|nr:LuxR C-terminal-related transcriptional regulator [Gaiellaceae bacterium]
MEEPTPAAAAEVLEQARDAYARRSWLEAHEAFSRADGETPLAAEDLELLSVATLMLSRDDEAMAVLERAHHLYLERDELHRAVRTAAWIGINLASRGAVGPASGWLGRAQRLLEQEPGESAEHGYLLLPQVFRHDAEGNFEAAAAVAGEAAAIGLRFGDRELFSIGLHVQGHMLARTGRVQEGLALLDEAMVAATTGDLSPFVVGLVYCGVILACQEVFEVGRAREWTQALTEWTDRQSGLLAFTGRCRVHRAEILQLGGSWADALDEARRACDRLVDTDNLAAAGVAYYRNGELLRLRGEFAAAETAYREASRCGWEPQPGLAQLRLAQGKRDAALAAIRRAAAETEDPLRRAALLPAQVEIALEAGEIEEARAACGELAALAGRYDSRMLAAMVAFARGAVALADGDARAALVPLREAQQAWLDLDAPYEVARTRALLARACSALGDEDASARELESAHAIFRDLGAAPDLARVGDGPEEAHGLSRRELEVLRLVAAGKSNRRIADELVISEHTVARHVQNIYAKLGLSSRAAATAFAFERHLV